MSKNVSVKEQVFNIHSKVYITILIRYIMYHKPEMSVGMGFVDWCYIARDSRVS